jgi:hypothetical protein
MSDHPPLSPHFTDVTPTDFGTTPSPCHAGLSHGPEPFHWASRPRSHGGHPRNTVVRPSRSCMQSTQEPTDPNSGEDACELLSTEV